MKIMLLGDLHLTDKHPICRKDDFEVALWKKLEYIKDFVFDNRINQILFAGDILDNWKSNNKTISKMIDYLQVFKNAEIDVFSCIGNHDMPYHSEENMSKSAFNILEKAGVLNEDPIPVDLINYGSLKGYTRPEHNKEILILHEMVVEKEKPPFLDVCWAMDDIKHIFPDYDLILTGHNHKTFFKQYSDGTWIVNPGSLMRSNADQIDHKPCFFIYDMDSIKQHFIPIEDNVISRDHLEQKKEKDEKLHSFVESLSGDYEIETSFEKNVSNFIKNNIIEVEVKEIIEEAIHG